jgi:adenosine deaminase
MGAGGPAEAPTGAGGPAQAAPGKGAAGQTHDASPAPGPAGGADAAEAAVRAFVRRLPKAELHLHIEGTLEPELLFELAARHGVRLPWATPDECRAARRFRDLQGFLDQYYAALDVLRRPEDFRDLATAFLRRAAADGTRHVEAFFDPQAHLIRGIPFATVVDGLVDGLREGERRYGLSWRLIACFLRDRPVAEAAEVLDLVLGRRDVIAGVGLDSAERDHPGAPFAPLFARARQAGLLTVAHAGEEGPVDSVREALHVLGVQRVDHGVAAAGDPVLVNELRERRVPLTMCPLSNRALGVTPDLGRHPLKRLLEAGVPVTVNSDDPAYFGGYLVDNYVAAWEALDLGHEDLVTLARNSLEASLLPADRRRELLEELARVAGDGPGADPVGR